MSFYIKTKNKKKRKETNSAIHKSDSIQTKLNSKIETKNNKIKSQIKETKHTTNSNEKAHINSLYAANYNLISIMCLVIVIESRRVRII